MGRPLVPRVLVIDDDPGTLVGFREILRCEGCEIVTAATGRQGASAAREQRFDVILADLRLGWMGC